MMLCGQSRSLDGLMRRQQSPLCPTVKVSLFPPNYSRLCLSERLCAIAQHHRSSALRSTVEHRERITTITIITIFITIITTIIMIIIIITTTTTSYVVCTLHSVCVVCLCVFNFQAVRCLWLLNSTKVVFYLNFNCTEYVVLIS